MVFINFTIYKNGSEIPVEQLCIKQKKKKKTKFWKLRKKTQINTENLFVQ